MPSPQTSENSPEFPYQGERLPPHHASGDILQFLMRRRSTAAKAMTGPGPSRDEISALTGIASRVPDHGKLGPWRFLVFEGESRAEISSFLADLWTSENETDHARQEIERTRFTRAPVVIAVISTVTPDHKIPEWEQILSAGAACQNLILGAQAMGYASQWLTEWYSYHPKAIEKLGLSEHERIAGFIHIGSANDEPVERIRPKPQVTRWTG